MDPQENLPRLRKTKETIYHNIKDMPMPRQVWYWVSSGISDVLRTAILSSRAGMGT
jgi:hypothetical protein